MAIVNRVAASGLIDLDPATLIKDVSVTVLELADFMNNEPILREKPFREALKTHDWSTYKNQYVAIHMNEDTIVPQWTPMLMTAKLQSVVKGVCLGNRQDAISLAYNDAIQQLDFKGFAGKNVIVKGCSDGAVPNWVYVRLMKELQPYANRISYGEACSSVPLYKR